MRIPEFHLKNCTWVVSLSIFNCVLAKEIVDLKAPSFTGAVKLGLKMWEVFVNGYWKGLRSYQLVQSARVWVISWKRLLQMWIVLSMLGSLWIFLHASSLSVQRRKEALASMCDERARMLQDQFNVSMNHIHALAILVSTFHHGNKPSSIDQKTFAEYTERTAFERPLTSGVAYAQRVLHAGRKDFEKQYGWTIKAMNEYDQNPVHENGDFAEFCETPGHEGKSFAELHAASPVQEEYAPVIFAQDTVAHVVSMDMMSGKEDRENILRARLSGRGVLTAPFKLLKSNRLGVILTFAVYNKELPSDATPQDRIQATNGYIGGIFDVESLVEKLLQQLACEQSIIVNVYDTTNNSALISMYGPNVLNNEPRHVSPLNFVDPFRRHEMQCRFQEKLPFPWFEMRMSVGALLISLLAAHVIYAARARIQKVEGDCREMKELKARAEAADVAKSRFLATVSHEIRTPMSGVLGMLQMLMDTDLDETQLDFVKTAQASGRALISLINEVLDQAKIEAGKLELEAVPFYLRAILDDVLSLFSGKSRDKRIELAGYVSDMVPEILIGDPGRFRQILTNLVDNSIKFTEKGHIFVSVHLADEVKSLVETANEPLYQDRSRSGYSSSYNTLSGYPVVKRARSWENFKTFNMDGLVYNHSLNSKASDFVNLLVSVEDTGLGIPLEAQTRIFTPFMQADSSTSRTHGGTGIGLSISKCLIDLMKGEIGFASERHIGTTFTFSAVFGKRHRGQYQPDHAIQGQYQPDHAIQELQGMTALVIDPRPIRSKVTKYHLQRLGIQVEISNDLKQGLDRLISGETFINLVLIDEEAWIKQDHLFAAFLIDQSKNSLNHTKFFLLATSTTCAEINAAKFLNRCVLTVIVKPVRAGMLSASLLRAMGIKKNGSYRQRELSLSPLKSMLHGRWILVVDDNAVNLRVAAASLKKYGANVECTESGKVAVLKLTPPHKFDACFMDVQMPEMDGFEATRRIRDREANVNDSVLRGEVMEGIYKKHWHIPILAMTADVLQSTHENCLRSGMDGYVSKPFEESRLYGEVARFFQSDSSSN